VPHFKEIVELAGLVVEGAGVLIILLGLLIASARFAFPGIRRAGDAYRRYREDLGKAILLGLEFLVAGDIIRTVAVSPTLQNLLLLGLIVLIRTFLSMALEIELEGRLPWKRYETSERLSQIDTMRKS
jgi:uncharacterized membrane protein